MKPTHFRYVAAILPLLMGGHAHGQAISAAEKAVSRACKAEGARLCAGKAGQDMTQCLRSNQEKLGSGCRDAVSKLPKPKM